VIVIYYARIEECGGPHAETACALTLTPGISASSDLAG